LHQGADSKVQHLGIIFSDRGSREAALIHANQQEHLMAIDVKTIERGALHEAKEFFWVFLYLYLCIGMLVVYKSLSLKAYGIEFAPYGFALVKAAILGKFILIGQALPMGRRFDQMPLIYPTLYRAFIFFILLVALSAAEEAVVGMWHGEPFGEAVSHVYGGTLPSVLAGCLVTFFFLVPYFALLQLNDVLGKGRLFDLFFKKSGSAKGMDDSPPVPAA
jgi:hypothetical protein